MALKSGRTIACAMSVFTQLNRKHRVVLFLASRRLNYDATAWVEAFRHLHRRIQGATPISRRRELEWVSLIIGFVLVVAAFSNGDRALWLLVPGGICIASAARVGWNRAKDAAGAAVLEEITDPTFGHDSEDVLILEHTGSNTNTISLNRGDTQYIEWHNDPPCAFESTYEYQIDGTKVLQRLLDRWQDIEGNGLHEVKDNIVLESEIRKYEAGSRGNLQVAQSHAESRISVCRAKTEWHELDWPIVKYFILSRHPESLPGLEYRRFFRQELERIETGIDALLKKAGHVGAELDETGYGASLRFREGAQHSEQAENALTELLSADSLIWFNISEAEFVGGKRLTSLLRRILGEPE